MLGGWSRGGAAAGNTERDLGYGLCAVGAVTARPSQDFLRTALLLCCATNRSKPPNVDFYFVQAEKSARFSGDRASFYFILFYLLNVALPKYIF